MSKKNDARRVEPFYLDEGFINPALGIAVFDHNEIELSGKMLEVLVYLAKNHERVVARNELIDEIWEGNYVIGEKAITHVVWQLRQVFDPVLGPKFIATVHRKGYQLNCSVRFHHNEESATGSAGDDSDEAISNIWPIARSIILLTAIVVAVLVAMFFRTANNNLQPTVATRITDLPGREVNHSISPDGKYLAFLWLPPDGGRIIYLKSLVEPLQPLRQLVYKTNSADGVPTWAPDSKHLAFVRDKRSATCKIIVINIDTGIGRNISNCADDYIAWSPDGQWLAYVGRSDDGMAGIYLKDMRAVMGDHAVNEAVVDVKVCCDAPIARLNEVDMAWSPDSQSLAMTVSGHPFSEDIYIYNLISNKMRQVTDNLIDVRGLTWTQDQEYLLYGDNSYASERSLYQINLKTGKRKNLNIAGVGEPVYSPDYKELYYYVRRQDDSIGKIELANESFLSPFPVIDTTHNEKFSDYSEALDKLVFFSDVEGKYDVWMSDVDGNNQKRLTYGKHQAMFPTWSASSQYVAYLGVERNKSHSAIYLLSMDDLTVKKIDTPFKDHGFIRWAGNDEELLVPVVEDGKFNIWLVSINGKPPRQLTEKGGYFARVSPDRKYLYYYKGNGENRLFRKPYPDGGEEELILDDVYLSWGNWDLSEKEIIYLNHHKKYDSLERLDIATKKMQATGRLSKRLVSTGSSLKYSAAKNMILFTRRERQQIDIMKSSDPHQPD